MTLPCVSRILTLVTLVTTINTELTENNREHCARSRRAPQDGRRCRPLTWSHERRTRKPDAHVVCVFGARADRVRRVAAACGACQCVSPWHAQVRTPLLASGV